MIYVDLPSDRTRSLRDARRSKRNGEQETFRGNGLKWLDSGEEIQAIPDLDFVAFGLDFVASGLVFGAAGLDFVGSGLDFVSGESGCPPNSAAARRAIGCAGPTEASASQSAKRREGDGMRTAYCFTPDRAFFAPAIRAIASLIEAEPDGGHEIVLVCEPSDVPPGFDNLARAIARPHRASPGRLLPLRQEPQAERALFARRLSPPLSRRNPARPLRAHRLGRFRHAHRPPGAQAARGLRSRRTGRSPRPMT